MKDTEQIMIEARREYHRRWREKNPDKVKAQRERFYLKKALEQLEQEESESKIETEE